MATELNYVPHLAARNLRNRASNTIGFIVNDITNPFYSLMLKEAERIAFANDYNVVFAGSDWSAKRESQLVEQMVQMRVCGVLVCLCEKSGEGVAMLDRYKVPYIAVDTYPD